MSDRDPLDRERLKNQVDRAVSEFKTGSITRALEIMEGLAEDLEELPKVAIEPVGPATDEADDVWTCAECGEAFDTPQGHNTHQRVHQDEETDDEEEVDDA